MHEPPLVVFYVAYIRVSRGAVPEVGDVRPHRRPRRRQGQLRRQHGRRPQRREHAAAAALKQEDLQALDRFLLSLCFACCKQHMLSQGYQLLIPWRYSNYNYTILESISPSTFGGKQVIAIEKY